LTRVYDIILTSLYYIVLNAHANQTRNIINNIASQQRHVKRHKISWSIIYSMVVFIYMQQMTSIITWLLGYTKCRTGN